MVARTPLVSDEVWAELDPRAGTVSREAARRITVFTALAAAVAVAAALLWISGLIHADAGWSDRPGWGAAATTGSDKTISTDVVVKNNGWAAIRVTGIGADSAGLRLTGITKPHIDTRLGRDSVPFTLQPGQTAVVAVDYRVTDCAAVTSKSFPIPVRVQRFWGTQTVGISIPTQPGAAGRDVEWQRALADAACGITKP